MGKIILGLMSAFLLILLVSFASAQIVFISQPHNLYNIGDIARLPVKIITITDLNDFFSIDLICNGIESQVYKQYLSLSSGSEKMINVSIPLITEFIGRSTGLCKMKANLGKDYLLTNKFKISNLIHINISLTKKEFKPGEQIIIEGNAVKENKDNVKNGLSNINVSFGNTSVYQGYGTVINGYFYFNFSLPIDSSAGQYLVSVKAYEVDSSGQQTNKGFSNFNILIEQVPTSLELIFYKDNQTVIPGQSLKIKGILHDQTGLKIDSRINFTIKDGNNEVMDEEQINTGEFLEVPISYNQPFSTWSVYASSRGLNSESNFDVLKNEKVSVSFINKTLLVTNRGNVPYQNSLFVKIGNKSLIFNVSLGVDKSQKYVITAPDGNYSVEILSKGTHLFDGDLSLTGNAVSIQQAGGIGIIKYPILLGFVLIILAFVLFFLFKRVHKRRFFSKADLNKVNMQKSESRLNKKEEVGYKDRMVKSDNLADLSLSIQGDKQGSSIVCLNIKNLSEVKSKKDGVKEAMDKLKYIAEDSKAMIYENRNYIFFIFAPAKTKTFRNEKIAIETAEKIQKVLKEHNRLFRQKIEFGISVNYGTIIARRSGRGLKFMTLGNFAAVTKKLSSLSKGEILLSKTIRERVMSDVKTEKHSEAGLDFYTLIEMKNRESSQKFIRDFMKKMKLEDEDD